MAKAKTTKTPRKPSAKAVAAAAARLGRYDTVDSLFDEFYAALPKTSQRFLAMRDDIATLVAHATAE